MIPKWGKSAGDQRQEQQTNADVRTAKNNTIDVGASNNGDVLAAKATAGSGHLEVAAVDAVVHYAAIMELGHSQRHIVKDLR